MVGEGQKTGKLGSYYIDMKKNANRLDSPIHRLDDEGVLLTKIPYTDNWDYYPVSIALFSLGNFEMYLETGEEKFRKAFLTQAKWLKDNIVIKGNYGTWEHWYTLPYYRFNKIPWVHGMAQGLAISALLRAYQFTNDEIFLYAAGKAYGAFERDIEDGGVRFVDPEGNVWFEEYAILPPPHVLNGFIFALLGIFDFYRATENEKPLKLFYEGVKTIEKNLPLYDNGYWSLYDLLHGCPATVDYHKLHIDLLTALYKLTGNELFNEFADRWRNYMDNSINKIKAILERGKNHWRRHRLEIFRVYIERKRWLKK